MERSNLEKIHNHIIEHRNNLNNDARERIKKALILEALLNNDQTEINVQFLDVNEEMIFSLYMMLRIQLLCKQIGLPSYVTACALSFYKRFYWKISIMEHDPRLLLASFILLAIKAEHDSHYLHKSPSMIDDLISKLGTSVKKILTRERLIEQELIIAKHLDFDFSLFRAHDALYGCFLRIQNHFILNIDTSILEHPFKEACSLLQLASLTDLELFLSWKQISLGIFFYCCKDIVPQESMNEFIQETTFDPLDNKELMNQLSFVVMHFIQSIPKLNRSEASALDHRLDKCINPVLYPLSSLYTRIHELGRDNDKDHKSNHEDPFQ